MRRERFSAKEVLSLFKRKKVSDLAEIKEGLGTQSTMTAFRKRGDLISGLLLARSRWSERITAVFVVRSGEGEVKSA
jgi:hypothetical protein